MTINNLPIDYQYTIFLTKFLPIRIDTNWYKQILYFTLAKNWPNFGNRCNALVTIGKEFVEIMLCKF